MSKSKLNQNTTANDDAEMDDDELLALMAEVEGDEVAGDEQSEADEVVLEADTSLDVDDELLAEAEANVELAESRADMIEDSAKEEAIDPETVAKPAAAKAAAKRTATPRQTFSTCSEAVLAKVGENYALLGADDKAAAATQALAFDSLAKKVKEKVINIFDSAITGKRLSNYTQMALDLLEEKGEFTMADLKAVYVARPYSQGTANSQAHQMSQLLPALGLATKTGSTLQLADAENPLFKALRTKAA